MPATGGHDGGQSDAACRAPLQRVLDRPTEFETQVVETPTSCWTGGVDRGGLLALDRGQVVAGGADIGPATDSAWGGLPSATWIQVEPDVGVRTWRQDS